MALMFAVLMCPAGIALALARRHARAVPAVCDEGPVRLLPPGLTRRARHASSAPPLERTDDRRYQRRALRRTAAGGGGSRRGDRMIAMAGPGAPGKLAAESPWAAGPPVLTERFGSSTAVNRV